MITEAQKRYRLRNKDKVRAYNKQWTAWSRGLAAHPSTGLWKTFAELQFQDKITNFIPCYWCNLPFSDELNACPECGSVKDIQKSEKAQQRAQKSYAEIVADNAIRAGKDPKVEMKKALTIQKGTGMSISTAKEITKKLRKYINTHNQVIPQQKICACCGREFNRTGYNQKYCPKCGQDIWLEHIEANNRKYMNKAPH